MEPKQNSSSMLENILSDIRKIRKVFHAFFQEIFRGTPKKTFILGECPLIVFGL